MDELAIKGLALLAATLFGAVVNGFTSRSSLAGRLATIETLLTVLQKDVAHLEAKVDGWPRLERERAAR